MHYFNEEHTNSNDGPAGSLSSTARGHTSSLPDVGPDVPIARPLTEINESTGECVVWNDVTDSYSRDAGKTFRN